MNRFFRSLARALTAVALLAAGPAAAACSGDDLRKSLDPDQRAIVKARLAEIPFSEGNHWIARKGGKAVHFIGTMHFNDARFDAVEARLDPVIAGADAVLFESTPAELKAFEAALSRDFSPVLLDDGATLPELMSEAGWKKLSALARQRGLPAWMLARMRPWFLNMTLSIPPCIAKSARPDFGLDQRIGKAAERHGVAQVSLERVEEAIALFERAPLEEQIREIELTLELTSDVNDYFQTVAGGYFEGRSTEAMQALIFLASAQGAISEAEFGRIVEKSLDTMLTQRNRNWIPKILAHPGDRLIVAVGAAHLSGEDGLLHLMEQAGYSLSRADF